MKPPKQHAYLKFLVFENAKKIQKSALCWGADNARTKCLN